MSLSTSINRINYLGDNSIVAFPFPYLFYATSHIAVYLSGVLQTTGYTVTGAGVPAGGTVTFSVAPGSGVVVNILRVVPSTQEVVLGVAGAFPAKTVEKALDLEEMGIQQLQEQLGRAVTLPISSTLTAANLPDPALPANFGMGVKIKGDGTGLDTFAINPGSIAGILTTKGDLLTYSTVVDRLPKGPNGYLLSSNSSTPTGLEWVLQVGFQEDGSFRLMSTGDGTKLARFDLSAISPSTLRSFAFPNKDGTFALTSEFAFSNLAGSPGRQAFAPKYIQGLTYGNNAGDLVNDLDIAAGSCRDATDAHNLILTALTKRSDAAWVVGTGQGALDTGAVGNSDYYIWAIKRSDTGVCDILYSLSSTAPTMPTSYDFKRLIGWFKRVGGTIVAFHTYETESGGIEHTWDTPTANDINLAATLSTVRRTDAVKVPLTFSTIANLGVRLFDATVNTECFIYCPDQTDLVPTVSYGNACTTAAGTLTNMRIRTSATGTIASRADAATVDQYQVTTIGFTWARRA